MAAAKDNPCQEYEKWVRLTTLIDFAGRHLCYDVLFKTEKLPTDGALLYTELEGLKSKICRFRDQREIVFPSSNFTDHNKFDLTLFTSIIENKFGDKYKKLVDDLRLVRNKEFHRGNKKTLSDTEFNKLWNDITKMLESHGFDMKLVNDVKSTDLFSHQKFKDLALLNFLDVTREDTKEVKELIEILTEDVCNAEKTNAQRFRQMKEDLTQIIESKLADRKVPAHDFDGKPHSDDSKPKPSLPPRPEWSRFKAKASLDGKPHSREPKIKPSLPPRPKWSLPGTIVDGTRTRPSSSKQTDLSAGQQIDGKINLMSEENIPDYAPTQFQVKIKEENNVNASTTVAVDSDDNIIIENKLKIRCGGSSKRPRKHGDPSTDTSTDNAKSETSLFSKKYDPVCLHMAILGKNLSLCQNLLEEENQRHRTCVFSGDRYQKYQVSLGKSGYIYQETDIDHLGVHITSPGISYKNCKTVSDDAVVSFESADADDLKWTVFHFAALAGDCKILRLLFHKNVSRVDQKNNKNQTCLHVATLNGNEGISKALIDCYNLDLHDADCSEWTPIHCAAYSGNYMLFQYLLDKGSDPFKITNKGDNCLHIASYCGHLRICELILFRHQSHGLSSSILNSTNHDGNTCLHNASLAGHLNICKLLSVYNIDTTMKNNSDETAHDIATKFNREDILVILNEKSEIAGLLGDRDRHSILSYLSRCTHDLNKPLDEDKRTLLHKAADLQDLRICEKLLRKGANINMKNGIGETPLHIVARQQIKRNNENRIYNKNRMYQVIRLLLHYDADIHIKNSKNQTVTDIFTENGDDYLIKLISTNESNTSRLLEAVEADDISKVSAVLQEKDNLGYKNFNVNGYIYDLPLHEAVCKENYDICEMLLKYNADVNKMLEFRSPLNIAEEKGNYRIANLLIKARNQDKSFYKNPLHIAVKEVDYSLCKFHLRAINVNSVDEKKRTALHVAIMYASDDLCKLLLKNGANIYARDMFNDTPLQLAFYYGRHELRGFAQNNF